MPRTNTSSVHRRKSIKGRLPELPNSGRHLNTIDTVREELRSRHQAISRNEFSPRDLNGNDVVISSKAVPEKATSIRRRYRHVKTDKFGFRTDTFSESEILDNSEGISANPFASLVNRSHETYRNLMIYGKEEDDLAEQLKKWNKDRFLAGEDSDETFEYIPVRPSIQHEVKHLIGVVENVYDKGQKSVTDSSARSYRAHQEDLDQLRSLIDKMKAMLERWSEMASMHEE